MPAGGDRPDGVGHLIEGVALVVDRRLQAVRLDGAHHVLEHLAASERHALEPPVLRHDAAQLELGHASRHHAAHRHRPPPPPPPHRLAHPLSPPHPHHHYTSPS